MPLLTEGESLLDVYTVERFLGEGAFAEVYRVHHRFLGRQAMKVFKTRAASLEHVQAQLAEALLLSRIGHPNVVRVYDANVLEGPSGPLGFFTMEYVAGGTLDRHWRSFGGRLMPTHEVVTIMRQACAGIAVAHAEKPPVIHRDIKPQNILVGFEGTGLRVRVSDFGLAKQADELSLFISAKGTVGFKPPEAFKDMDSTAADVWALGTTMYLLLTDTWPYPELNDRDDLTEAGRFVGELRQASTFNAHVDEPLDNIVARCLAKDPRARFRDAIELSAALGTWMPEPLVTDSRALAKATGRSPARPLEGGSSPQDGLRDAMQLAKDPRTLGMAADLLEQVLNYSPELRDQYEGHLDVWRRGVCM